MNVNVLHCVYLTKAVLPLFLRRKERSAILNTSSVMSHYHCPGFILYSASKVFMTYFSLGLAYELSQSSRVDVLDYKPGYVETKLSGAKQGTFCITPEVAAKCSIDDLGQTVSTNAVLVHQLSGWVMKFLPSLNYFAQSNFYKEGVKKFDSEKKRN